MKPVSSRILFFLIAISISCTTIHSQEESTFFLHTIEKGQSLYSISSMYGISQSEIIRLNPGCEDKIYARQTLRIPQKKASGNNRAFHTIQPGETLYKLTTIYKVSAGAIIEANPGLSADNFRIGQVIRIPLEGEAVLPATEMQRQPSEPATQGAVRSRCREMHKVKRRETIFSVSREYSITDQELIAANPELKQGMKKGQFLCIPYTSAQTKLPDTVRNITPPTDKELFLATKDLPENFSTVKAAILLPLLQDKRMIEYYEGFLMAVDSLKRTGVSMDIYTYNVDDNKSSLNTVLAKDEMKRMNVIFGPAQSKHTNELAAFAKKNNIRMVIPFSSKEEEVFTNPYVYQINTPQSYLYSEVYEHFTRRFPNANVILLEDPSSEKEKKEFIQGLKQELKQKGIPIKTLPESASKETMKEALRRDKDNVFIPTSGSNVTLIKIIPQLNMLVNENPETGIQLFGYPEWQTYTKDHLDSFFKLDTYFYSSFYTNNLLPAAIRFTNNYRKWYSKEMVMNYPKYGMLGFDTGFFFLKGLSLYGSELENNLSRINLTPIQTGFSFQRVNNWGGFINKKVFFVHFTRSFELVKIDFE